MVYVCKALSSLPRDLYRRHPHANCTVRNPEGVDCRENGISRAFSPRYAGEYGLAVFMWPWVRAHMHRMKLLHNWRLVLAPCWLCVPLVYKGVGTSGGATLGLLGLPHPRIKASQTSWQLHAFSSICPSPVWTCPALNGYRTRVLKFYWILSILQGDIWGETLSWPKRKNCSCFFTRIALSFVSLILQFPPFTTPPFLPSLILDESLELQCLSYFSFIHQGLLHCWLIYLSLITFHWPSYSI